MALTTIAVSLYRCAESERAMTCVVFSLRHTYLQDGCGFNTYSLPHVNNIGEEGRCWTYCPAVSSAFSSRLIVAGGVTGSVAGKSTL